MEMKYKYPAIIKYNQQDGVYYVNFPDIEGCFTDGQTLYEALENAQDALNTMISFYEDKGYSIPQPSNIKLIAPGMNAIVTTVRTETQSKIAV